MASSERLKLVLPFGAGRSWALWLMVLPLAVWAFVRAFGLEGDSGLAPFMAFTPIVAFGGLVLVGLCLTLRNWTAAAVASASLAVLALVVLPRAAGEVEAAPRGATRLTVLSANILRGRADPERLLDLVNRVQPDLLAVQELTRDFTADLRKGGLARRLPYSLISQGHGVTESGLFSSYPLRGLPSADPPNPRMPRAELALPRDERIKVVNVHPFTPTGARADDWAAELSNLPSAGGKTPWLLVGDFNATLDHAVLREVLYRGYRDAGDVAGEGLTPTWPRNRAYPPLIAIDHILADRRLGIASFGLEELPGSDHRVVHAEIFMARVGEN